MSASSRGGTVLAGAMAVAGIAGCGSSSTAPAPSATATTGPATSAPATSTPASAGTAGQQKIQGPIVQMDWGPVQATIVVKNHRIVNSFLGAAPENGRSQFIDTQAAPILHQETLATKDGNIQEVSGATLTSGAYIQSLQAAIKSEKG